jgi:hypothetical protein
VPAEVRSRIVAHELRERAADRMPRALLPEHRNGAYLARNWNFESISLQRRVNCEPVNRHGIDPAVTSGEAADETELRLSARPGVAHCAISGAGKHLAPGDQLGRKAGLCGLLDAGDGRPPSKSKKPPGDQQRSRLGDR